MSSAATQNENKKSTVIGNKVMEQKQSKEETQTNKESNFEDDKTQKQQETLPCKYCNKIIGNKKELNIHERFRCRESRCAVCNKKFENNYELQTHEIKTHKFIRNKNETEAQEKARIMEIRKTEQEQNKDPQEQPNKDIANNQDNGESKPKSHKPTQDKTKIPAKNKPQEISINASKLEQDELSYNNSNDKPENNTSVKDIEQKNKPDAGKETPNNKTKPARKNPYKITTTRSTHKEHNANQIKKQDPPKEPNENSEKYTGHTEKVQTEDTDHKDENSHGNKNIGKNENKRKRNKQQKSKKRKCRGQKEQTTEPTNPSANKEHNDNKIKSEISKLIKKGKQMDIKKQMQ